MFVLLVCGCAGSPELVSEGSVQEKLAKLSLGKSDKTKVEEIFGAEHGNEQNRWVYYFSDRQFQMSERTSGSGIGLLPFAAGVAPTNTRALITVVFNESGTVKRIEVARFFEPPFVNEYWYLLKSGTKEPLQSIEAIGASIGFKPTGLDKSAGTFTLEDSAGKARLAIKLGGQTLQITSRNPYDRLSNEYRVYRKRETAFTDSIGNSELVQ